MRYLYLIAARFRFDLFVLDLNKTEYTLISSSLTLSKLERWIACVSACESERERERERCRQAYEMRCGCMDKSVACFLQRSEEEEEENIFSTSLVSLTQLFEP
jgi:hypothetical protein